VKTSSGHALVTGGSRGIGAAIVVELERLGFNVTAPSRSELDLSDIAGVERFANAYAADVPDVVVLNAGENIPLEIAEISLEHWSRTMDINVTSAFALIKKFGPQMMERGGGRITAISSCYSMRSRPGRAPYSASKAALNSLVRSSALEFAKGNVLVNAVAPGFVLTDLTRQNNDEAGIRALEVKVPLGRLAEPNEVASLVGYLSGPTNTYITGQLFVIDGGFLCQ
jgi:NAD(P)-dependent dehydrogenase (short-subunit alcohol dehydrogenase family)